MRKTREILLGIIILGLVLNLLGNAVWHYLPDSKVYPHTHLVATMVLIIVCILHLLFAPKRFYERCIDEYLAGILPVREKNAQIRTGYEIRMRGGMG